MSHRAPQYYYLGQVYYGSGVNISSAGQSSDNSASTIGTPHLVIREQYSNEADRLQLVFPPVFGLPNQEVWFERRVRQVNRRDEGDETIEKDTVLVSQQLQNLLKSRTDATVKGDNQTGEFTQKKRNYKPVAKYQLMGGATLFVKVDREDEGALSITLEGSPSQLPETVFVFRAATLPKKSDDDSNRDYSIFINVDKSIQRYHEYRNSQQNQ